MPQTLPLGVKKSLPLPKVAEELEEVKLDQQAAAGFHRVRLVCSCFGVLDLIFLASWASVGAFGDVCWGFQK